MKFYNTMTRAKEELSPIVPGTISMYVCGPTVYNLIHIGNARPLIIFDTLRRYLEFSGYKVTYVQNFTDIDDKLIRRGAEENLTIKDLADKYISEFYRDVDSLSVKHPTATPRATEHIDDIIALISKLIKNGFAYSADNGDVYFAVRSFKDYGKLSGQSVEELESGARVDPTEHKKDPLDFALWKGYKEGEPFWNAPWGKGRPGWHIECSAMSMDILGETFDIHAGGVDLVFPHHENEIAQSEAATGKPFANLWMHNGHINVNSQKMSKSAGNFFLLRDILKDFSGDAVRLFMLSSQYRTPINFSFELMEQAKTGLLRIKTAKERLEEARVSIGNLSERDAEFLNELDKLKTEFIRAMDDDLNTADAIGSLFDCVRLINTFVTETVGDEALRKGKVEFYSMLSVLGLLQGRGDAEEFPKEALLLLNERAEARANKNYARSDEIREKLKTMGFMIEDGKNGAKLKRL
ncbi:MAG: cysteine--tRNA ligase [Clostridia bacterium]